jgi:glycosyltransferase involved in cell wall biosynthesis
MRILAVYRHYWPDATPYARLLKAILERAAAEGHDVTVYTAQPSYNDVATPRQPVRETLGGVKVRRVRLLPERKRFLAVRALNAAYFLARAILHATLRRRYDLLLANVHPPLLAGAALRAIHAVRRTPFVLHVQDIHPESLRAAGRLRDGGPYRGARRLDTHCCRRAERLVTLSADMADALAKRGLDRRQIAVINNSPLPLTGDVCAAPGLLADGDPRPTFLFAGNLGEFQALDALVEAARQLARRRDFRLVFLGAGAARSRLVAAAGDQLDRTIYFLPHASPEAAVAAMRRADYGIVSLAPQVYRYAYPSKSMTYLSAGCPLVTVVEPASELARTVVRYELGYVAASHSPAAIVAALHQACDERYRWTAARRGALAAACESLFGEQRMLEQWMALIGRIDGSRRVAAPTLAKAA